MKSKRILLVNNHLHFGGGGDAVFRLERSFLENSGFEVHTFSHSEVMPQEVSPKDHIHLEARSWIMRRVQKYVGSPGAERAFRQTLRKVEPEIVHLHLVTKYPVSIYRQLIGENVIQTLHGPNLFCATSWGCVMRNSADCEMGVGWKCFQRRCVPLWRLPVLRRLYTRQMALAKATVRCFLCPSRHLQRSALAFELPARYVALGIDREFLMGPTASHVGVPGILFVGGLTVQKGPDILLEAFMRLAGQHPGVRLRFAGRGPLQRRILEKADKAGIRSQVECLGFLDRETLAAEYRMAHVMVMPSIWKEQFGLIGPEALACGTPCVGSNIGGIPEWLHDSEWGFLVPPRDPGALAARIDVLLRDRALRLRYGERGREFVIANFAPERYERSLMEIIQEHADLPPPTCVE